MAVDAEAEPQEGAAPEHQEQAAADPIEALAREAGWQSRDELRERWGREPTDWQEPAAFLRNLGARDRENRDSLRRIESVTARLMEDREERTRQEVRQELRAAVDAGDPDAAERAASRLPPATRGPDPAVAAFAQRNASWWNQDAAATAEANAAASRAQAAGAGATEQVEAAEAAVRRRFPELFGGRREEPQRRDAPQMRGGDRSPAPPKRAPSTDQEFVASLSQAERRAGEEIVRRTQYNKVPVTLAQYAKALAEEKASGAGGAQGAG